MCDNQGEHTVFKIPEVIEHIFKFCNFADLKCCRLVSKHWQNASNPIWLSLIPVRIQEVGTETDRPMSEYLQFTEENVTHKNVNFRIKLYSTIYDFSTFIPFWKMCGPQIQILQLYVNMFSNPETVRDILFKYCPNMTSLSFHACYAGNSLSNVINNTQRHEGNFTVQENKNVKHISISPESIICANNISWMELFTNYPNLQGFQLLKMVTEEHVNEIFGVVNIIRKNDPKKLKLKDIHCLVSYESRKFRNGIPPSLLKFLQSGGVKIENLSLTINDDDDLPSLSKILNAHMSTLETLVLDTTKGNFLTDSYDYYFSTRQIWSILPRLSKLTLSHYVLKLLKFLKYMPNLKKLAISNKSGDVHSEYSKISEITLGAKMEHFRLSCLTDLELNHYENSDGVRKLIRWFPNVDILTMPLSNETFELVCQGWSNLKTLNINKSTVDECGITGLDSRQVIRINMAKGNFCNRSATVPKANITALKQLESFHMSMSLRCNSLIANLTFCSVLHGFQKAACPQNIVVKNYHVNKEFWVQLNKTEKKYRMCCFGEGEDDGLIQNSKK